MGGDMSILGGRNNEKFNSSLELVQVAQKEPPKPQQKCSTEEYCKVEALEISSLDKMIKMDEENTKKLNITIENFNETWDAFMKDCGKFLPTNLSTFTNEKEKVKDAFTEGTVLDKEFASTNYKKAVDETLEKITETRAKEYAAQLEAEKNKPPPPPDPKKKK